MSTFEKIPVSVCAVRLISSLQADFKAELKLDDSVFSLGIFTADSDDVAYIAADEATKQANVRVVYGSSFYAGAKHGPSSTAGEVILMLAGPSPAEVRSGLDAALSAVRDGAAFQWANDAHTRQCCAVGPVTKGDKDQVIKCLAHETYVVMEATKVENQ